MVFQRRYTPRARKTDLVCEKWVPVVRVTDHYLLTPNLHITHRLPTNALTTALTIFNLTFCD